jgi:DNA-binding LytR/AlgR family response regulator
MPDYNCLIIEDEPLASEILEDYIHQVSFLQLKGVCRDALFAASALQKEKIDLIFLDIHLPKLKGLDFLKTLKNPPLVILTTAYHEYALQSYELNVVDYLLKPIEFNRFLQAIQKLPNEIKNSQNTDNQLVMNNERAYHFFNVDKKKIKIYLDEILYIESIKEYVRVVSLSQTIITKYQLGQLEEFLNPQDFIRIHRSFLVAKAHITAYTSTFVELGKYEIPIGRNYKELIMRELNV